LEFLKNGNKEFLGGTPLYVTPQGRANC